MAEVRESPARKDGRRVFGAEEAAAYLGVHRDTVYKWVKRGRIPHVYIGTRLAIPQWSLDRWLDAEAERSVGTRP